MPPTPSRSESRPPARELARAWSVATSYAASAVRLGAGIVAGRPRRRPEQPLRLYEFEGCPYCRKVREALTALDLEAHVLPCPKGGPRFRPEVERRGGKAQFPYLVDPNSGKEMYESDAIVQYLYETYGDGPPPWLLRAGALGDLSSMLAGAPRLGSGVTYRPARQPAAPLELYSFEGSPYCRLVRETLTSLELPYLLHNVGKGSESRDAFVRRSGRMQVPWLVDPNPASGEVTMFESADIAAYLERSYAQGGW